MHDLTDDDRTRLGYVITRLEQTPDDNAARDAAFLRGLLDAPVDLRHRMENLPRFDGDLAGKRGGLYVELTAVLQTVDAVRGKLAEQSSGDQGLRERLEKLPTFEPEHDESRPQPYALGNDPIEMAEEQYPDTMGPAEWLRRSDVLAALTDSTGNQQED